jgi:diguanylate cyclase (GGDEF)-like protein
MSGARQTLAFLRRGLGGLADAISPRRRSTRDQELLDGVWDALNIGRDNKALVVARDGTIIKANPLAHQLCGRSSKALLGEGICGGLLADEPVRHPALTSARWETLLRTKSGAEIAVEVTRQPLGDRFPGIEAYAIRDLRERREVAEERERHNEVLRQRDEEIRTQHLRFEMALTSLSQGVCLFDAEQRLVICNEPYRTMYAFSHDQVRPGTPLKDILAARVAVSPDITSSPQEFVRERLAAVAADTTSRAVHHLADGRIIEVVHHPIPGGGWVATHEDVSERRYMEAALEQTNRELEHHNNLLRQREDELKAQNVKFDAALDNMLQGVAMFDAEQRLIVCNKRYAEMYGLTPEQVRPGTTVRQIFDYRLANGHYHVKDTASFVSSWADDFDGVSSRIQELVDGRTVCVTRRRMANGGRLVTHEDITERRRLDARLEEQHRLLEEKEKQLRLQNVQLDAALNNIVQGLAMFDAEQRLVVCNARYAEIYELTPDQVRPGVTLLEIIEERIRNGLTSDKSPEDIVDSMLRRYNGVEFEQFHNHLSDGRCIAITVQPMAGGGTVTTHQDITEQRRSEEKIAHMALHDTLTGLPNRVLLNERLEHALARVRRGELVATHIFDLDYFKTVNDTLGHPAGDKLLKEAAARLQTLVRETDTVARMGGDEFAIVQVGISQPADATSLAQRIIAVVSEPYHIEGHQVVVGASVGIAIGPSDGTSPEQIIRNADLALYRAKDDGRGTYRFFEPEMDAQMQARRELESDLRKALAACEFKLHYQPVVDLASNEISGFEALIRWHHPVKGLIAPNTFIPLAEEIGLIVPIGEWALRQACATAAKWPARFKIAVNLSPAQFRSPGLLQAIVGALAASGLAPERLELEITETILLQDSETTLGMLYRLRELGVRIAMDDFGTGYSSLSYLQSFPFDKIKIDRSFVRDIAESTGSLNIVRAVAALAKGLGMTATAEGVETAQQLDTIRAEGCTEMQGYLFSRPLPAEEIEKLFLSAGRDGDAQDGIVAA